MYSKLHTTLYHGTNSEISMIDVSIGHNRKDFGRGFYMSESKKQAIGMMHKKFRVATQRKPLSEATDNREHLYEIKLNPEFLKQMNIKVFYYADMEWLDFVLMCRNKGGMPHDYDMVVGPTADDDTAVCLQAYEQDLYGPKNELQSKQTLLKNLEVENLGIQYYIGKQEVVEKAISSFYEIDWR